MRQFIIPIFIPYSGCPFRCIFCNQERIAGEGSGVDIEDIKKTVDTWLSQSDLKNPRYKTAMDRQIAFYGGTFTALPLEKQEAILSSVSRYLEDGVIDTVRVSTRPDRISPENLAMLKRYRVRTVELGVQSMDSRVLSLSERGYSADDVRNACSLLKRYGFHMGIQIMPGLPGDTWDSSLSTVDEVIKLRPDFVRIYPAVVIRDTGLADLYLSGSYKPLSLEDAVMLCKILLMKLEFNNIPVIRIGLQHAPSLVESGVILGGPFHSALRQLVESEIAYDIMKNIIYRSQTTHQQEGCPVVRGQKSDHVTFFIPSMELSNFIGQKRVNIRRLNSEFNLDIHVRAGDRLKSGEVIFDNGYKKIYIERREFLEKILPPYPQNAPPS
jgi:histone acetyltransferase (RNA polymerase elongator complex component)